MYTRNRVPLLTSSLVATSWLMLSRGAMADVTGTGYGMMGHGGMYGFGWMWIPWLLVIVLGVALIAVALHRR